MKSNQTIGVLFFIRKELGGEGLATIYLRITVDRKRAELSLKRNVDPSKWVPSIGRAKGNKQEVFELNEYLNFWEGKVYHVYKDSIDKKKPISAIAIKSQLLNSSQRQKSLIEVFDYHNAQFKALVGTDYAAGTLGRYQVTLRLLKDFLKKTYNQDDILLSELNYRFVTDLDHYFKMIRGCNQNTTSKYIINIRKIIRLALLNQWIEKDPFVGFRTPTRNVERGFLSGEELEIIENKQIDMPRIALIRDLFIFSCYTGLAYADLTRLSWENIVTGIDGDKWISISRQKTDTKSRIPILEPAWKILLKYQYDPLKKSQEKLFPILSNQRMNSYLKIIGDLCGFEKHLTTHLARHTFATTVTLTNGVPIESVSSMLGHNSIRTTQIYAKVVDKKVSQDMSRVKKIYSSQTKEKNSKEM